MVFCTIGGGGGLSSCWRITKPLMLMNVSSSVVVGTAKNSDLMGGLIY